jgi:transcriptional regulator with XRE-family HTH domain
MVTNVLTNASRQYILVSSPNGQLQKKEVNGLHKVKALCGLIHAKYDSEADFSRKLGWNRQRLNRITTGRKAPTLEETAQIASALNESFDVIAKIFLQR